MPSEQGQVKVLIIDDEEAMRDSCTQALLKEGYDIRSAIDGHGGLKMVEEYHPDVVLIDLKMPGISGQEVLESIGRYDDTIATIVITGYPTISMAIESMRYGAYDFLPKPFTPDELRSVVSRSLDRRNEYCRAESAKKEKSDATRYYLSMIRHEVVLPLKDVRKSLSALEAGLTRPVPMESKEKLAYCTTTIERIVRLIEKWQPLLETDTQNRDTED